MRRKTRLQAKLMGEEYQAPQESATSNSEMIEKLENQTNSEPDIEIQLMDPSPALDFKSLAEDVAKGKTNLKKMRKADLLAMATAMGLAVTTKNTKNQIITAIEK